MWDTGMILFAFTVQTLGYVVKGLVGFGNPLIAAPLLSMKLDNAIITPGTLLLDTPINAFIAWKNRDQFQWRQVVPLLLAVLAGVVPGVLLLKQSFPWVLKAALGVLVLGLGVEMATREQRKPRGATAVGQLAGCLCIRHMRRVVWNQYAYHSLFGTNCSKLQCVQGKPLLFVFSRKPVSDDGLWSSGNDHS